MWYWWKPPQLLLLLQAAAQGRTDLPLAAFDEGHVRWALETGLGPLLFWVTQEDPGAVTSPLWPLVRGAERTAALLAAEQQSALSELLAACEGRMAPLVLLKGISISTQHYPLPSLRPMRDLDVLVEQDAVPTLTAILHQLGYEQPDTQQTPAEDLSHRHHASPFFHPHRELWIEVHWGLFSALSGFATDKLFRLDFVRTQFTPSSFQGRAVTRLSTELQLAYIAAHWQRDYNALHVVGGVFALLDLLYVLRHTGAAVHWEYLLELVHGSAAAAPLYLLLTYLVRSGLLALAPATLHACARSQRTFGPLTLALMHTLIDQYVVDGRVPGPLLNARNLSICWESLLLPGPPLRNLGLLPWRLLPSRSGVRERLANVTRQKRFSYTRRRHHTE